MSDERWRLAFRLGVVPLLTRPHLEALRDALEADSPRLIQGNTACFDLRDRYAAARHEPCAGACALGYALWQVGGLRTTGEVFYAFRDLAERANLRLLAAPHDPPLSVGDFTAWADRARREAFVPALLAEVRAILEGGP